MPHPLTLISKVHSRSTKAPRFFRHLPQWGNEVLRTAMDNALTRQQLRLIWPVTDQLDLALERFHKAVHDFTPGLNTSPSSLTAALQELSNSYNYLQNRLETLPLVRSNAGDPLRQILTQNRHILHDAGIAISADGRRCETNSRHFTQKVSQNTVRDSLWGEDGLVSQLQDILETMRNHGPENLMDPESSIEDIAGAWKDLARLEQDSALVDCLISTLDDLPQKGLMDEKA